uniref:Methyltransferase n=1 Tax=viral metagenome TaxID=1070528 RepID=A0A6C0FCP0_9ZZZZ|tara:strand:- start:13563 stop:14126 length:564 start_codon:yes stop_codon:yes gene_type:complete
MPALESSIFNAIQCDLTQYSNFVETGTFLGETIYSVEPFFNKLYTIEVKEEFYRNHIEKYKGDKIKFYLGDSGKVLGDIIPEISGKTIFFLDGHYSAGITGTGEKHVPLYEELTHIMTLFKEDAVIIIDDLTMFGRGPNTTGTSCDWEDISIKGVINLVTPRLTNRYTLPSSQAKNDRLILHLKALD